MPGNTITRAEPKELQGPGGVAHAITIGLDLPDRAALEPFMAEVIERFKIERMLSHPDTTLLLISIIGEVSAAEFSASFRRACAARP